MLLSLAPKLQMDTRRQRSSTSKLVIGIKLLGDELSAHWVGSRVDHRYPHPSQSCHQEVHAASFAEAGAGTRWAGRVAVGERGSPDRHNMPAAAAVDRS